MIFTRASFAIRITNIQIIFFFLGYVVIQQRTLLSWQCAIKSAVQLRITSWKKVRLSCQLNHIYFEWHHTYVYVCSSWLHKQWNWKFHFRWYICKHKQKIDLVIFCRKFRNDNENLQFMQGDWSAKEQIQMCKDIFFTYFLNFAVSLRLFYTEPEH